MADPLLMQNRPKGGFKSVVARTKTALQEEVFGVLIEIDIQIMLKAKIGEAFRPHVILGTYRIENYVSKWARRYLPQSAANC